MPALPRPSRVLRLPPRKPHRGRTVLTLGLLALLLPVPLGFVLGPLAWKYARQDIPRMRRAEMDPNGLGPTRIGQGAAVGGIILGILLVIAAAGWGVMALLRRP